MTEKRFKHSEIIQDDGQIICYGIEDTQTRHIFNVPFVDDGLYEVSEKELIKLLNELHEENEQLKKREEQLLSEIEDFQQLLTKNDNICYKRVIDLIDTQIKNGEEAIEWGKNMNADYGAMGFHIEMLKKLKKELE